MGRPCNSTSSSTDSSASSLSTLKRDLSTDLKLGSSISHSQYETSSRDRCSDWPPIKPLLRSTLAVNGNHRRGDTFFVKVYMEGVPIGRKLDLFAHDSYDSLGRTLQRMFGTTILCPNSGEMSSNNDNVLAYEDKEGDWMMVGDVPWEMFLTTVKRLKITRENKC